MAILPAQRAFGAGEIAPGFYGRVDTVRYAQGLRTCRNMLVQKTGGITNRSGTEFCVALPSQVALLPWSYTDEQTYVLFFGQEYFGVLKNGVEIESAPDTPLRVATPYGQLEVDALRFVQAADRMTLVHPNHPPYELIRNADDDWTLQPITFGPEIDPPENPAVGTPGTLLYYAVAAVDAETFEESLLSDAVGSANNAGTILTWDAVTGANRYRVYRSLSDETGPFGLIGETAGTSFTDQVPGGSTAIPLDPNTVDMAPTQRTPFASDYPVAVTHYQQRELYANTSAAPETVYASRTGLHRNFTVSSPVQDDNAVTFTLQGHRSNQVLDMLDLGRLIVFTRSGAWVIDGDQAGILRPGQVNPRQLSYYGIASRLPAIPVGNTALYVQQRGGQIRDLRLNAIDGVHGADLTVGSAHLFAGLTIVSWAYQETPESILWCVRSDGVLLGCTYIEEAGTWGWHRHDTDGRVARICVVPEGNADVLYLVVARDIQGDPNTWYLERLTPRFLEDVDDGCFMDASIAFDGRDPLAGAETMTLTGGTTWGAGEELTITCTAEVFIEAEAGNSNVGYPREGDDVILHGADGLTARVRIIEVGVGAATATCQAVTAIPASCRLTSLAEWDHARAMIGGSTSADWQMSHLEGRDVSVLADGIVLGSPNNPSIATVTVENGGIALSTPAVRVRVGLPYLSDIETLDMDAGSGASIKPNRIQVTQVGLSLVDSRGGFVGPSITDENTLGAGFKELPPPRTAPGQVPALRTEFVEVPIPAAWTSHGRVAIRQVDPLPLTITAIVPVGTV